MIQAALTMFNTLENSDEGIIMFRFVRTHRKPTTNIRKFQSKYVEVLAYLGCADWRNERTWIVYAIHKLGQSSRWASVIQGNLQVVIGRHIRSERNWML
jgi:hypothetical protein